MLHDCRLAWRTLRATPLISLLGALSLALGIGANTAVFSVINALLLRALPVTEPERLVLVTDATDHVRAWSYQIWREIRARAALFERSAAWSYGGVSLSPAGEAQMAEGLWASGSLFQTLGVPAAIGRTLTEADDNPQGTADGPVAMISHAFWLRRFGGAPDILGRPLTVDGVPVTIVGVTPRAFSGPEVGRAFDIILPLGVEALVRRQDSSVANSGITFLTIIARLNPGQSIESATSALRAAQGGIRDATIGDPAGFSSRAALERYLKEPFTLVPGARGYSGARDLRALYGRPLTVILTVVALLLLIACVNVANLLTARALARKRELSVRLALGASRRRLVRMLFAESLLLYAGGASLAVPIGMVAGRALVRQLSTAMNPVFLDVPFDGRVLTFTVVTTLLVTLVFGTAPAYRLSGVAPGDALTQERSPARGSRGRLPGVLVFAQVALSVVLLVVSGLLIRTFTALSSRPLGFDPGGVLVVTIDASRAEVDAGHRLSVYERAREAVRALPGVAEAALSLRTPVGRGQFTPRALISGIGDPQTVWGNLISPGWLAAFGTPIVAGRDLSESDRQGAPRVAVVNETFARRFSSGASPIGKSMTLYPGTSMALGPIQIVGVVRDAVYSSLRFDAPPSFYVPLAQFDHLPALGIRTIALSVKSAGPPPMLLARAVADAVARVDPRLTLTFRPLTAQVDASLAQERLVARLAGCFGALALLLAGLGLYGVTAHDVAMRRAEIGIRLALGAQPRGIARLVLARASFSVGAGLAAGLLVSLWATSFVSSLLYGLRPRDPVTLTGALIVLASVAAMASWLPARRAARTDPAVVLREA
jgi:putative ABC transport system permease protein